MSIYNALFEAASKLKKGAGNAASIAEGAAKSTRDAARATTVAAKQSETVKAAGPALGKVARYAAYPAGIGVGLGAGSYVASVGISGGVSNIKDAMMPSDEDKGGALRTVISIAILLALGFGVVKLYGMVKG